MDSFTLLVTHLFNILIVVITSLFAYLIAIIILKRMVRVVPYQIAGDPRIRGIMTLFLVSVRWVLIGIVILLVLSEFEVNVAPLLAGAGVVGIAISFAAQALLKDIAAGIGIFLGNTFRPGDVIVTNGIQGVVEHISLMKTIVRDKQTVYTIPNGQMTIVGVVQTAHQGSKAKR